MQVTTITVNLKYEAKVIPKWSLYCPPEVAKEDEGDDGDGDEAEGEVPPQLHRDDLVSLPSLIDLQHSNWINSIKVIPRKMASPLTFFWLFN